MPQPSKKTKPVPKKKAPRGSAKRGMEDLKSMKSQKKKGLSEAEKALGIGKNSKKKSNSKKKKKSY